MTKYTVQFKLVVVQSCLRNSSSLTAVAHRHGIVPSMVRQWVGSYQLRGKSGLEKKFTHYTPAFKLSVLRHMRKHNLSYSETAIHFDIRSSAMVGQWVRSYHDGGLPALIPRTRGRPKKMPHNPNPKLPPKDDQTRTREELLAELDYLRMENAYLKKLDALIQAQKNATLRKPRK